ncbi:cation-independent mannose-6-phosphate receptor isoform X1 [Osmia bicornis bicornis]|uniref:cation-independent mannose-6-phosphate receptor isoform X1 n=1 Tax=Osmia bicornis bicornis TaxID=1437191 RepID=UPI0010F84699|nr:cation-independent mannose-6-phosphate receptor isoform X1 [Osmia bicornis bicornis]
MYKLNILLFFYCFATAAVFAQSTPDNFCIILEPVLRTFSYNLTSLSNPEKDVILHYEYLNETIRLQLCTSLKQKCNGKYGYSICLTRNNEEKGIGKMPPKVDIENGRIMFVFSGDDCTSETKYNVNIVMKCDYEAGNNSFPELFYHTLTQCNLYMVWKTALACGPRITQSCTVTDNGLHYDLSPLTRYSQNYVIHMGNKTSPKIILNVCHSVIFEYNALCQMHSGACLQDASKSKYVNLGEVQHSPFLEDGKLKLVYQEGDMCKMNITEPHIKTTISFICDFEAMETIPEYVGGNEECHYQLIWKTAAACSVESLRNHSAITAGKCTVNNPLTNFTYDLRPLMNNDSYINAQNGIKYQFGVCKSPKNSSCVSGTGACLTKNSTSMGRANTNLMWEEGGPYLNYTNGDLCENGQRRYTVIAFLCGAEGSPNEPLVMEQNSCQLIIHWNTNLVCEKRIKCATDDDEINLSSLIRSTNNYVVKVNKTEFHINICRPLVPVPGLTCAHGSAGCKASISPTNEYVNEVSLGFPKESPIINSDHETVLRYIGGSPCPENLNKLISTNFTFPCRSNDKGSPEFKGYKDCTYMFEWKTSITCGAVMGNWTPPCIIKDQLLSHECNLSLLHKNQPVYYVKNKQGKTYSICICGGIKLCNNSAICQGNNGYGSLTNVIFDYGRNIIKLHYSNGGKCNVNSSYTSDVRFICNESIGIGEPKLLWESQCNAEFEWHTNVTCTCQSNSQQPTASTNVHEIVQDFSASHTGTVAGIVLSVIVLVAAFLYFRDPDKRACFRSCFNPFSSRRGSGRVQYCRVDTTEEARLLLDVDPTQCQTDSDDDMLNA